MTYRQKHVEVGLVSLHGFTSSVFLQCGDEQWNLRVNRIKKRENPNQRYTKTFKLGGMHEETYERHLINCRQKKKAMKKKGDITGYFSPQVVGWPLVLES